MQVLIAKRQEEICTGSYSNGLRSKNWVYENKTTLIFAIMNKPELLFLLKVQITKIKITRHRVIGDEYIWEEISLMNACWVSQSVLHQYLKAVSDGLFKNIFNGEIIFHLKRYWKGSIIAS